MRPCCWGDRSSRDRRVAARPASRRRGVTFRRRARTRTIALSFIYLHAHTHTHIYNTHTHTATQPLVDFPVASRRVGGPRGFSRRRRPGRRSRMRRPGQRAGARARATSAKIGRHARAGVKHTPCQNSAARPSHARKYSETSGLTGTRVIGSYQRVVEKRPVAIRLAEASIKSLRKKKLLREVRAARRSVYRQLHVHTATVAPQRGRARRDAEGFALDGARSPFRSSLSPFVRTSRCVKKRRVWFFAQCDESAREASRSLRATLDIFRNIV